MYIRNVYMIIKEVPAKRFIQVGQELSDFFKSYNEAVKLVGNGNIRCNLGFPLSEISLKCPNLKPFRLDQYMTLKILSETSSRYQTWYFKTHIIT